MLKYAFILFACCFLSPLAAQITPPNCYDCKWVLGYDSNELDVPGGGAIFDFNIQPTQISFFNKKIHIDFTSACTSDRYGNLQMYSNGCAVYGKDNIKLENGGGLNPGVWYNGYCTGDENINGYIARQGMIILPFPDRPDQYCIIHKTIDSITLPDYGLGEHCRRLNSTVVDMSLNNGKGKVTQKNTIITQDTISYGQLMACRHANGRDWWLLSAKILSDKFYRYLLSPEGVALVGIQTVDSLMTREDDIGQAVYSPDGTKYIRNRYDGVDIYDFDRCSGIISNHRFIRLGTQISSSGSSVSPNSRFLYVSTGSKLYQFDLEAANIESSKTLIATPDNPESNFYQQLLGADGKIYIIPAATIELMHTIESPNLKGDSCNLQQNNISLPCYNAFSLPNMPNFRLGRLVGSSCDTLATAIAEVEQLGELRVQPNPATDLLHIAYHTENTTALTVAISDYTGKKIQTLSLDPASGSLDINTSALPNGLYLCTLYDSATHRQQSVKFVVMR